MVNVITDYVLCVLALLLLAGAVFAAVMRVLEYRLDKALDLANSGLRSVRYSADDDGSVGWLREYFERRDDMLAGS